MGRITYDGTTKIIAYWEILTPHFLKSMGVLLHLVCLLAVFVRCRTESYPDVLMEATVPIYNQTLCRESYAAVDTEVTDTMLCAGYSQGAIDSCQGDSGGPLVALSDENNEQYYLIGIVSFGEGCAEKGFPGVYTRVTQYEDWIRQTLSGFPDGATCGRRQTGMQSLVIGGCPAEEHAWPWMVAMFEIVEGEPAPVHVCGASLIDPWWIITAAHCVETDDISIFEFGMGSNSLAKIPTRRTASEVYVHPNWTGNDDDDEYDIALFKLSEPVVLTNDTLTTVCLPTRDMDDQFGVGHSATVTGWGNTQPEEPMRRQDKIAIICLSVITGLLLTTVITGLVWYLCCKRKGSGDKVSAEGGTAK